MDKESKKEVRIKICKLLDENCQECPNKRSEVSAELLDENCGNCPVLKEIRNLAYVINGADNPKVNKRGRKTVNPLTVEQYIKDRERLSVKEIAELHGISEPTLYMRINRWREKGVLSKERVYRRK